MNNDDEAARLLLRDAIRSVEDRERGREPIR